MSAPVDMLGPGRRRLVLDFGEVAPTSCPKVAYGRRRRRRQLDAANVEIRRIEAELDRIAAARRRLERIGR